MGHLLIDAAAPAFDGGIAHVWLEERAPADAAAARVAGTRIEPVRHRDGTSEKIRFAITTRGTPPSGGWSLRAWIDIDGIGPAERGDLFSTTSTVVRTGSEKCVLRVEDPARLLKGGQTSGH